MCTTTGTLYCILPPYILQNIVENGTDAQRQQALDNIILAEAMRMQREDAAGQGIPPELETAGPGVQRIIYTADFQGTLPGRQIRTEGGPPTGDPSADEAYDGAGATYDLYAQVYGRDSMDGRGLRLDSTVHYRKGYDNAFWNGRQMVYGDGDEDLPEAERLFNRFTIAIDIIGHELTHGVTQFTSGLLYTTQSGALNESMSDVFGSLVKQRQRNQTASEADWIIGQGLFTPNVSGVGIRSVKEPGTAYNDPVLGKDPQPGHMRDYVHTTADNGGVHINSGIPNRAFYITAVTLGGPAWEKAGRIWYVTLRDKLRPTSQFTDAARLTYQTAGELFGPNSNEQRAVRAGWEAVGVNVDEGEPPPNGQPPRGCAGPVVSLVRSVFGRNP